MSNKKNILTSLISFDAPLEEIIWKLNKLGWNENLVATMTPKNLQSVLSRFLSKKINKNQIEDWANAIESREDIIYIKPHEKFIKDIIYELANPFLTSPLTFEKANKLLIDLIKIRK